MTPPVEPKELDPISYLTKEEKMELLNLARQRASAINEQPRGRCGVGAGLQPHVVIMWLLLVVKR